MTGLNPVQYAVLMTATILSSMLSITGSTMIIVMARRRMGHIYHRLVAILSFADLGFSLCSILQTFLVPEESGLAMAIGTDTSCTAIAFLFQWFAIMSPLYNCILSVYFPLVVKPNWRQEDFLWKFEIPAHVLGVIVPLVLPIVGLITGSFTVSSTVNICTYGAYPPGCLQDPEIECERGAFSIYLTLANFATIFFVCIIGVIATILVFCRVREQLRKSARYNFRPSNRWSRLSSLRRSQSTRMSTRTGSMRNIGGRMNLRSSTYSAQAGSVSTLGASGRTSNRNIDRRMDLKSKAYVSQVRSQALMYSLIFFNNVFWPMMTVVLFFVTGGSLAARSGEPGVFTFMILSHFFYPLAGAMNIMVYIRPKYKKWRTAFPDHSSRKILKNIVLDENLEEHIRIAKRERAEVEKIKEENQNEVDGDHQDANHQDDNDQGDNHQDDDHQNNDHPNNDKQSNDIEGINHQDEDHQDEDHQDNDTQGKDHQDDDHQNDNHQDDNHQGDSQDISGAGPVSRTTSITASSTFASVVSNCEVEW